MSESLLLITNADAGTADEQATDAAIAVLKEATEVDVRATGSLDELDDALASAGDRRIVIAGGDGSLHAVVASLHRRDDLAGRVLGLIPLGTGNDFARTLGIPLEPEAAAQVLIDGKPREMDLVVDDDDDVTVNGVHIGASAEAGKKGAWFKKRLGSVGIGRLNLGRLGYPMGALLTAVNPPTLRVRVVVDDEVVVDRDRRVLMVAVGNGASVGGGTELTPDALPHDGELDVLVASPMTQAARLAYALRLSRGDHEQHGDVQIVRGRQVQVSGTPFDCNSDGEIDGPVESRTWKVLPAAYSMVVPG